MKSHIVGVGIGLFMASSLVFSQEQSGAPAPAATENERALPASLNGVCLVRGVPAAAYTFVKNVKVAKGTYGSASELLPELVEMAKVAGADAIVEYSGSQRFGFWPWRLIRPVAYGKAVKWNDPSSVDCTALAATGEAAHQAEMKRRAGESDAKAAAKAAKNEPAPTPAAQAAPTQSEPVK